MHQASQRTSKEFLFQATYSHFQKNVFTHFKMVINAKSNGKHVCMNRKFLPFPASLRRAFKSLTYAWKPLNYFLCQDAFLMP